jgi:triacylglycerol lipase
VKKTGCEKLNVIAHSKGGLDTRYALAHLGVAPMVASLTTVNTPHNGCVFADELLKKLPQKLVDRVARSYNAVAERAGDEAPDFLAAVKDLTAPACIARNAQMPLPAGVLCQSVGSRLNRAQNGRFPLNVSYHLVKHYDGPNDGLVAEDSFPFGERHQLLTVKGRRGISHCEVVDMTKENLPEFDVREFYVQLVADLKARGL